MLQPSNVTEFQSMAIIIYLDNNYAVLHHIIDLVGIATNLRVHMPLLDHSQHAHVAPNTGIPRNTHTIMHATEQYMFCTPGL